VDEIMLIQERKAQDNNINMYATINLENTIVKTDCQRVMQVLLCLQSNALKFTKDGEVEITVDVEDGYLNISVRDTGIGISKENQSKLFKLFGFLKDSQQMNKNGIGLGLVISRQLCQ
jgi:signal transduction histidine kinase